MNTSGMVGGKAGIALGHGRLKVPLRYLREDGRQALEYVCVDFRIEVQ